MSIENREHRRFPTQFQTRMRGLHGDAYDWSEVTVKDLSSQGGFIQTIQNFPRGTMVQCELSCPETGKTLQVMAKVCWNDDTGMGVEFCRAMNRNSSEVRAIVGSQLQNAEYMDFEDDDEDAPRDDETQIIDRSKKEETQTREVADLMRLLADGKFDALTQRGYSIRHKNSSRRLKT